MTISTKSIAQDPRDPSAIVAFIVDAMPDMRGVVDLPLLVKSRTPSVQTLTEDLEARGYTVSLGARVGDHWVLEVRGVAAGVVPWPRRLGANISARLAERGESHTTHGLTAWPELEAEKGAKAGEAARCRVRQTIEGHLPSWAKVAAHAAALGCDPHELYLPISFPLS